MTNGRFVAFDVDGTISCGTRKHRARPGIGVVMSVLQNLGYGIHLWSAGGEEWAREVAKETGLDQYVTSYSDKVPLDDLNRDFVEGYLGRVPALVLDDDPKEYIPGIAFLHLEGWYGGDAKRFEGWTDWDRPPVISRRSGGKCGGCGIPIDVGDKIQLSRGKWVCVPCGTKDTKIAAERNCRPIAAAQVQTGPDA